MMSTNEDPCYCYYSDLPSPMAYMTEEHEEKGVEGPLHYNWPSQKKINQLRNSLTLLGFKAPQTLSAYKWSRRKKRLSFFKQASVFTSISFSRSSQTFIRL